MSLLDRFRTHECKNCGTTENVERTQFDGEVVGHYCRDCRLFSVHTHDS